MQEYNKTDQHLHQLCQIIAKANRTFVEKKADDSHTNLAFDTVGNRISGRWIKTPKGNVIIALELNELTFQVVDKYQEIMSSIPSIGKTRVEIEKLLSENLGKLGLETGALSEPLHFEIPNYSFAEEVVQSLDKGNLSEWKKYRKIANEAAFLALDYLQVTEEVRIWPHHFDTGTYVEANEKTGIGIGLAMQDEMVGEPYFYIAGYALKGSIDYEKTQDLSEGSWKVTEGWKGAVLPLSSLKQSSTKTIEIFLKEAIDWYLQSS